MTVASRETRAAAADLHAARDADKTHLSGCIDCRRATNRRRPADRCAGGIALAAAVTAAAKRWRDEQDADRQPAPGQGKLF